MKRFLCRSFRSARASGEVNSLVVLFGITFLFPGFLPGEGRLGMFPPPRLVIFWFWVKSLRTMRISLTYQLCHLSVPGCWLVAVSCFWSLKTFLKPKRYSRAEVFFFAVSHSTCCDALRRDPPTTQLGLGFSCCHLLCAARMAVPRQVTQFIERTYPRPRVDPVTSITRL